MSHIFDNYRIHDSTLPSPSRYNSLNRTTSSNWRADGRGDWGRGRGYMHHSATVPSAEWKPKILSDVGPSLKLFQRPSLAVETDDELEPGSAWSTGADIKVLASYDWIDAPTPTIIVPGMSNLLTSITHSSFLTNEQRCTSHLE